MTDVLQSGFYALVGLLLGDALRMVAVNLWRRWCGNI